MTDYETDAAFVERMEKRFILSSGPCGGPSCVFRGRPNSIYRLIALARLAVTQPAAAPDAGGWLPIESAPKDGTEVDLWHTSGWRLLNCYWVNSEDGEWRESGWTANGWFFWPNEDITHWRTANRDGVFARPAP